MVVFFLGFGFGIFFTSNSLIKYYLLSVGLEGSFPLLLGLKVLFLVLLLIYRQLLLTITKISFVP